MKKIYPVLLTAILAIIVFSGISYASHTTAADFAFVNGNIYTVNEKQPHAEAVAVSGEKIIFVGSGKDVKKYIGKNTKVIDLKGRLMLPGFIDAHCHPIFSVVISGGIVIGDNSSIKAVLADVKKYIDAHPDQKGYFGFGWDNNLFPATGPTREMLDEICPDKPIVLLSNDAHAGWMNTAAMKQAGITKDFPDPEPGISEFVRDKNGEPTGAIKEAASMVVIKKLKLINSQEIIRNAEPFFQLLSRYGITTVFDAGVPGIKDIDEVFEKIKQNADEDKLPIRFFGAAVYVSSESDLPGVVEKCLAVFKKYNTDRMRLNTLKLITDGTFETRKAAVFEPYVDTKTAPDIMYGKKIYHDTLLEAAAKGIDIHLHTIGDKAVSEALEAAAVLRAAGCKNTRITLAHVQSARDEDMKKFRETGVFVNTTGSWFFDYPVALQYINQDVYKKQFRFKHLAEQGVIVTQGSDYPASDSPNPLDNIEKSHTRTAFEGSGLSMTPLPPADECLSLEMAVKTCTLNGARQLGMEKKLGSIEKGKYADLVVLRKNIFKIPAKEIHKSLPILVMMNGKIRYREEK
ncbi:MAG: amidohydrolase [Firmicutes bacterium]|nr:amidohydrolase [Bacillota bacterium]